jgi:carboxyl-terminal processing protease
MKTTDIHKTLIIIFLYLAGLASPIANAETFGGFGIVVAQIYDDEAPGNRGGIVILHVPGESEADRAGLKAGDIILEIDGRQTAGREFGDVVLNSLRGEPGSSSSLVLRRTPENEIIEVRAKRSEITYETP